MNDNGTAEWSYRQSVKDRPNAEKWRKEARRREEEGKTSGPLPVYSGLLGAFFG